MNVRRAGGEARTSEIPLIVRPDGCEYAASKEEADCFGLHFSQKCSLHDRELTPESVPHLPSRSSFSIDRIYFRQANVLRQLKRLDASKASGPDGICRVLKECATELALPLSRLFSLCLQSGYQPSSIMLKTTSAIKSTWPFMQTTPRWTPLPDPLTPYQTHTGLSRAHAIFSTFFLYFFSMHTLIHTHTHAHKCTHTHTHAPSARRW